MWISLALLSAVGGAGTSLALKRAVTHGGTVVSTVLFRLAAAVLLAALTTALDAWVAPTPAYWRATALVVVPEVGGTLCLSLALRHGDVSLVQPILGMLPLFVMLGAAAALHEIPTAGAAAGVALVAAGVYCVGLRGGASALEPLRALRRSRASWLALAAAALWSVTTVLHKVGIAEVGPFPWATTVTICSALPLAAGLPFLRRRLRTLGVPARGAARGWMQALGVTALCFVVQQVGLHQALQVAQAGYVVAVSSTSILIAGAVGVLLLGERAAVRARLAGSALVTAGAALIALFG